MEVMNSKRGFLAALLGGRVDKTSVRNPTWIIAAAFDKEATVFRNLRAVLEYVTRNAD